MNRGLAMKLGFLSSIVPEFTFEQVIDFAAEHGFKCVELAELAGGESQSALCRSHAYQYGRAG